MPIGGGVGKIVRIGALPVDVQLGAYYNVVRPDHGPEWELRAQVQFLFPRCSSAGDPHRVFLRARLRGPW